MIKFLTNIDFCFSIVGLNYKGERRYKSPAGGIITILLFCITTITIFYHFTEFFTHKVPYSPRYNIEDIKYWSPPRYNLTKNFTVALTTQYQGKTYFREDLINIDAYAYIREEDNHSLIKIDTIPCKKENFIENEHIYESLELESALCFNFSDLFIEGSNLNQVYSYIMIKYSICKGENCKSDIKNILEKEHPITYIYFLDTTFQMSNKTHKIKHFINYVELNISYSDTKTTNIFFSQNEVNIDENSFFFVNPKRYINFVIESFRDLVSTRPENESTVLTIKFLSSTKAELHKMQYSKISDLIANISAYLNISILIFVSLGDYINNFFFQNDLLSALYSFKTETQRLHAMKDTICQGLNLTKRNSHFHKVFMIQGPKSALNNKITLDLNNTTNNVNVNVNVNNSSCELKEKEENQKNLCVTFNKNEVKKLKIGKVIPNKVVYMERSFNIKEILVISFGQLTNFFHLCGSCNRLRNRYKMIKNKIIIGHDMIQTYQKLQEIDILKFLLLTQEQLNLYGIIPKPVLLLTENNKPNNSEQYFSTFYNQKNFHYLKSTTEFFDVFREEKLEKNLLLEIFKKNDRTQIDNKLIKIFEERLFPEKSGLYISSS